MSHSPSPPALPAVVLVRPREEGNVGSAARAMANMGLSELVFVDPAAALGSTARMFAVGARHVLDASRRAGSIDEALAPYRRIIGTTSTRDRRMDTPLLTPRDLPQFLAEDPADTPTALIFGPEVGGLTNEELARAHAVVHIPCAPEQPTLNLAQAALLVIYELWIARLDRGSAQAAPAVLGRLPPASAFEIDGLLRHAEQALGEVGFARDDSFGGVLRDLRQLAGRAALDGREVAILRGILRRTERALEGKRRD